MMVLVGCVSATGTAPPKFFATDVTLFQRSIVLMSDWTVSPVT